MRFFFLNLICLCTLVFGQVSYEVQLSEKHEHFFVVNINDGTYLSGEIEARRDLSLTLYQQIPDAFDYFVVFTNFPLFEGSGFDYQIFYIQNQISGIGLGIFDDSSNFGSTGRLKSFLDMGSIASFPEEGFDRNSRTLLSALVSSYLGRVGYQQDGTIFNDLGTDGYWSPLLNVGLSFQGGNSWKDLGDNQYIALPGIPKYTDLDLYLMGFCSVSEVPSFELLSSLDPDIWPGKIIDINGKKTIQVEDIIGAEGERAPSFEHSQKDFRVGIIFLTNQPLLADDITRLNKLAVLMEHSFNRLTKGRGHLDTHTVPFFQDHYTEDADLDLARQWICDQVLEGIWSDTTQTSIRETAEVIKVLAGTGSCSSGQGQVFLESVVPVENDLLARVIFTLSAIDVDTSNLLNEMAGRQNIDGGWGSQPNTQSSVLDTAQVLYFCSSLLAETVREKSIQFLLSRRNEDGTWHHSNKPDFTSTLLSARSLAPLLSTQEMLSTIVFLAEYQYQDGGFGKESSQILPTIWVADLLKHFSNYQIEHSLAIQYLDDQQRTDGSFGGLIFETAGVLALLEEATLGNLVIEQLVTSNPEPYQGEIVTFQCNIANRGKISISDIQVQLWEGHPDQGGQLVEEQALVELNIDTSQTLDFEWTATGSPGERQIILRVLTPDPESSPFDNELSIPLMVKSSLPDLFFTGNEIQIESAYQGISFQSPSGQIFQDDTILISAVLTNGGLEDALGIEVWATSGTPDGPIITGPVPFNMLTQNETIAVELTCQLEDPVGEVPVYLHCRTTSTEVSLTNNLSSAVVTVSERPEAGICRLRSISFAPSNFESIPQTFQWTVEVNNPGQATLPHAQIGVVASYFTIMTPPLDVVLDTGASITHTFEFSTDSLGYYSPLIRATNSEQWLFELKHELEGEALHEFEYVEGSISVLPDPSSVGSLTTVAATFINRSLNDYPDVDLSLFGTGDGGPTNLMGNKNIYLVPGEQTLSFSFIPDQGYLSLQLQLVIDGNDTISELDESNNVGIIDLVVTDLQMANLLLRSDEIVLDPDPPIRSQNLQVSIPVHNTGQTDMAEFQVDLFLGNPAANGQLLETLVFEGLPSGETQLASFTWESFYNDLENFIYIQATSTTGQLEVTNDDNLAFKRLRPINAIDLTISPSDVQIAPVLLAPDIPLTIQGKVQNLGDLNAPQSVLYLYANEVLAGSLLGEYIISEVPPHTKMSFQCEVTGLNELVTQLVFKIDALEEIIEYNEFNNQINIPIVFRTGDFYSDTDYFSPNDDGIKDQVTFYFANTGNISNLQFIDEENYTVQIMAVTLGEESITWDGNNSYYETVRDGNYTAKLVDINDRLVFEKQVVLDTNHIPFSQSTSPQVDITLAQSGEFMPFLVGVSPDKNHIFYKSENTLWMLDLQSGNRFEVLETGTTNNESAAMIFSGNGEKALLIEWLEGRNQLKLVDLNTLEAESLDLEFSPYGNFFPDTSGPELAVTRFHFSQNGRYLYYYGDYREGDFWTRQETPEGGINRYDLYTGEIYYSLVEYEIHKQYFGETGITVVDDSFPGLQSDSKWNFNKFSTYQKGGILTWRNKLFFTSHYGLFSPSLIEFLSDSNWYWWNRCDAWYADPECPQHILANEWIPRPVYFIYASDFRSWLLDNEKLEWLHDIGDFVPDPNSGYLYFNSFPEHVTDLYPEGRLEAVNHWRLGPDDQFPEELESPIPDFTLYRVNQYENNCSGCPSGKMSSLILNKRSDNLFNQFGIVNDPLSAIYLYGTCTDQNIEAIYFDYAYADHPSVWLQLQQAKHLNVYGDLITYWIPSHLGDYLIRVTVVDKAGNRNVQVKSVKWRPAELALSGLVHNHDYISPNGDGRQDFIELSYQVNLPSVFSFEIRKEEGLTVRTIEKNHPASGSYQTIWDGRDDEGIIVPDGTYFIKIADQIEIQCVVDTVPPQISYTKGDLTRKNQPFCDRIMNPVFTHFTLSANDPNLAEATLEERKTITGGNWKSIKSIPALYGKTSILEEFELNYQMSFYDMELKYSASDLAGNIIQTPNFPLVELGPRIWLNQVDGAVRGPWSEDIQNISYTWIPEYDFVPPPPLVLSASFVHDPQDPIQSLQIQTDLGFLETLQYTPISSASTWSPINTILTHLQPENLFEATAQLVATTQSGMEIYSETFRLISGCGPPPSTRKNFIHFKVDTTLDPFLCNQTGNFFAELWEPESGEEVLELHSELNCTNTMGLINGFEGTDPEEALSFYLGLVAQSLPMDVEFFVDGQLVQVFTFTEIGQMFEESIDPLAFSDGEHEIIVKTYKDGQQRDTFLASGQSPCGTKKQLLSVEENLGDPQSIELSSIRTLYNQIPEIQLPVLDVTNKLCAGVEYNIFLNPPFEHDDVSINHNLIHTSTGTLIENAARIKSGSLALEFNSSMLQSQVPDTSRDFQLEMIIKDRFGHCETQFFEMEIDFDLEADLPIIEPVFFSPNGDGVKEMSTLHFVLYEDIALHYTQIIKSGTFELVKTLAGPNQLSASSQDIVWDGTTDSGNTAPDGDYIFQTSIQEFCGLETTWEKSVTLDRTLPVTQISLPEEGAIVGGLLTISGIVEDNYLASYLLEFSMDHINWQILAMGQTNINGTLSQFHLGENSGTGSLRLTAEDLAGNQSQVTRNITISPSVLIGDMVLGSEYISPNGDGILDNYSFSITLNGEADLEILLKTGEDVTLGTLVDEHHFLGTYPFSWDGTMAGQVVSDGIYVLFIVTSNGVVTEEAFLNTTVDTILPNIEVLSPSSNLITNNGTPMFNMAIVEANPEVLTGMIDHSSGAIGAQVSTGASSFSVPAVLDIDGQWNVNVISQDRAGNVAEVVFSFILDTVPPELVFLEPLENSLITGEIVIGFSLNDIHQVSYILSVGYGVHPISFTQIQVEGPVPSSNFSTIWIPTMFQDGPYTLQLEGQDVSGNQTTISRIIDLDLEAPLANLTSPVPGLITSGPGLSIQGSAEDLYLDYFELFLSPGLPSSAHQFSVIHSGTSSIHEELLYQMNYLPIDGSYTLKLEVHDRVGRISTEIVGFQVDTHVPDPPVLTGQKLGPQKVQLTWNSVAAPDLDYYEVYRDESGRGDTTQTTFTESNLEHGTYLYQVRAVDWAGNQSLYSNPVEFRIDLEPPTVKITQPLEGSLHHGLITILGTANDLSFDHYELRIHDSSGGLLQSYTSTNGVQLGELYSWASSNYNGTCTMVLSAWDTENNQSETQVSFEIDNQPPATPVLLEATHLGSEVTLIWQANIEFDLAGYVPVANLQALNGADLTLPGLPDLVSGTNYVTQELPDGEYEFALLAFDLAAQSSPLSNTIPLILDTHPPHVTMIAPVAAERIQDSVLVEGQSEDDDIQFVLVEGRETSAPEWTTIALLNQRPFLTSWDMTTLPYGGFEVRMVATDEGGQTDSNPEVISFVHVDLVPPPIPQNLGYIVDGTEVQLTWDEVNASDLAGYRVFQDGVDLGILITEPQFTHQVTLDAAYRYQVLAEDLDDNSSDLSDEVIVTVYTPTPHDVYPILENDQVVLTGVINPLASMIEVRVDGQVPAHAQTPIDLNGFYDVSVENLPLGVHQLHAIGGDENGNYSRETITPVISGFLPIEPTNLNGTPSGNGIQLNWDLDPQIQSYLLHRDGEPLYTEIQIEPEFVDASSSGTYSSSNCCDSSNAFDGDAQTWWLPENNYQVSWIEASLLQEVPIHLLDIDWDRYQPTFQVQVEKEGNWLILASYDASDSLSSSISLRHPVTTSKIRLFFPEIDPLNIQENRGISEIRISMLQGVETNIYLDDNLPINQRYLYSVQALDTAGRTGLPAEILVTFGDITPPEPPQNFVAVNDGPNDVSMIWDSSPSVDVIQYGIYENGEFVAVTADLSFIYSGRPNGTHTYYVTAYDTAGNESNPSNSTTVAINGDVLVSEPTNLFLELNAEQTGFLLSWEHHSPHAEFSHFAILRRKGGTPLIIGTTQELESEDTNVFREARYYYNVASVDTFGNLSNWSNEVTGFIQGETPDFLYPGRGGETKELDVGKTVISGVTDPGFNVALFRDGLFETFTSASLDWTPNSTIPNSQVMAEDVYYPVLSLDGRYMVLNASTSTTTDLIVVYDMLYDKVNASYDFGTWIDDLQVSPDGKHIAVQTYNNDLLGSESLYLWSWESATLATVSASTSWQTSWFDDQHLAYIELFTSLGGIDSSRLHLYNVSTQEDRVLGEYSSYLYIVPIQTTGVILITDWDKSVYSHSGLQGDNLILRYFGISPRDIRLTNSEYCFIFRRDNGLYQAIRVPLGSGQEEILWQGSQYLRDFYVTADDRYIVGINNSNLYVVDLKMGTEEATVQNGDIDYLRVSPSGTMLLACQDTLETHDPPGTFRFDDVSLNLGSQQFQVEANPPSDRQSMALSPILTLVRISPPRPDAAVTASNILTFPAVPSVDENVYLTITIENMGNQTLQKCTASMTIETPGGQTVELPISGTLPDVQPGGTIQLSQNWVAAQSGEYGLHINLDQGNSIVESDETNNLATHNFMVFDLAEVELQASLDKTNVLLNDTLITSIDLLNGGVDRDIVLETSLMDEMGFFLSSIANQTFQPLYYGEHQPIDVPFSVGILPSGSYQIYVTVKDFNSHELIRDRILAFEVLPDHGLEASISTLSANYNRGESVLWQLNLHSLSQNHSYQNLIATLTFEQAGSMIHQTTVSVSTIQPQGQYQISGSWLPPDLPLGIYDIKVVLHEGETLRAQADCSFSTYFNPVYLLTGQWENLPQEVIHGDVVSLIAKFTNRGNTGIENQIVDFSVTQSGQIVMSLDSQSLNMQFGEEKILTIIVPTVNLDFGTYEIHFQTMLPDGNITAGFSNLTVSDGDAPVIMITGVSSLGKYNNLVTPQIEIYDDSPLLSEITLNGQPFVTGTPVSSDGSYQLFVLATDNTGNTSNASVFFSIDKIRPLIVVSSAEHGGAYPNPLTLNIEITDENPIQTEIFLNNLPYTSGTPIEDEGLYTLLVNAADDHGNIANDIREFELLSGPPRITIQGVSQQYNKQPVTLDILIEGGRILSQEIQLNQQVFVSGTEVTEDGAYELVARATNAMGIQEVSANFVIDTQAPTIFIAGIEQGMEYSDEKQIEVLVEDNYLDGTPQVTLNGVPYISLTPINQLGDYILEVQAEDLAGNTSQASRSFSIVEETIVIIITGVEDGQSYTHNATPVISVIGDIPAQRKITLNGDLFSSGTLIQTLGHYILRIEAHSTLRMRDVEISFLVISDQPYLQVTPDHLNLGERVPGQTHTGWMNISNLGTGALQITGTFLEGGTPGAFQLGSLDNPSLESGEIAQIPLTFSPLEIGDFSAIVHIETGGQLTYLTTVLARGVRTQAYTAIPFSRSEQYRLITAHPSSEELFLASRWSLDLFKNGQIENQADFKSNHVIREVLPLLNAGGYVLPSNDWGIYLFENGSVQCFQEDRKFKSMCLDYVGNQLFLADHLNRIWGWSQGGDLLPIFSEIDSVIGDVHSMAYDPQTDRIMIYDDLNQTIFELTQDGTISTLTSVPEPLIHIEVLPDTATVAGVSTQKILLFQGIWQTVYEATAEHPILSATWWPFNQSWAVLLKGKSEIILDPQGSGLPIYEQPYFAPRDAVREPNGDLCFIYQGKLVRRERTGGQPLVLLENPVLSNMVDLVIGGPDHSLYMLSKDGEVYQFNEPGSSLTYLSTIQSLSGRGLAVDDVGVCYVADNQTITRIPISGSHEVLSGVFTHIKDLTWMHASSQLVVADQFTIKLVAISSGDIVQVYNLIHDPESVAVDADNQIWYSCDEHLYRLNTDGSSSQMFHPNPTQAGRIVEGDPEINALGFVDQQTGTYFTILPIQELIGKWEHPDSVTVSTGNLWHNLDYDNSGRIDIRDLVWGVTAAKYHEE